MFVGDFAVHVEKLQLGANPSDATMVSIRDIRALVGFHYMSQEFRIAFHPLEELRVMTTNSPIQQRIEAVFVQFTIRFSTHFLLPISEQPIRGTL